MAWWGIDDRAPDHPKLLALSDGAFRLWVEAGCYCVRHLTDGQLVKVALATLSRHTPRRVAELLTQGLWEPTGDGYRMHDYHQWNETKAEIESRRAHTRERMRRFRNASRDASQTGARDASRDAHVPRIGEKISTPSNPEDSEGEPEREPLARRPRQVQRGRLFLHRWQTESLIATLGPHVDTFDLDLWLDALNQTLDSLALPRDPWKFIQTELHAEIARRGLAVVGVGAALGGAWEPFACPHEPECHGRAACDLKRKLDALKANGGHR